jgi:hypothetical protein
MGVEIVGHIAFDRTVEPVLSEIEDADALDVRLELFRYVVCMVLAWQLWPPVPMEHEFVGLGVALLGIIIGDDDVRKF